MKYLILCDEKPKKCEGCLFLSEKFEPTDTPNYIEIKDKCYLGANDISECPMTVMNTVFTDEI